MKGLKSRIAACCVVFVLCASLVEAKSLWEWRNPLPQGNDLYDVWGSSGTNVFAVGAHGTILHYDGVNWTLMDSGTTSDLQATWGSSGTDVFAVGVGGTILHYDGTRWTKISLRILAPSIAGSAEEPDSSITLSLSGIWGSSAKDIFIVGSYYDWESGKYVGGVILHFDGTNWVITDFSTAVRLSDVWGSSGTDVFVVGEYQDGGFDTKGIILHYDGKSWNQMEVGSITAPSFIWGTSSKNVFTVAQNIGDTSSQHMLFHYDGVNWSNTGVSSYASAAWGSSNTDMLLLSSSDVELFDGAKLNRVYTSSLSSRLYGIWGSSATDVFVVGENGLIVHYDGLVWSEMSHGHLKSNLSDIWGISPGNMFALENTWTKFATITRLFHYDGTTLSSVKDNSSFIGGLVSLWGNSETNIFAVGSSAANYAPVIVRYDGVKWTTAYQAENIQGSFEDVWGSSGADFFAVGEKTTGDPPLSEGIILHYDGTNWMEMDNVSSLPLRAVWGSSGTDVFAVGGNEIFQEDGSWMYEGEILHYDGMKWTSMTVDVPATNLKGVWGSSGTDVFAVGTSWDNNSNTSEGVILHYDGKTWTKTVVDNATGFTDIWGSSGSDVFVLGGEAIWHFNGKAWKEMESPTSHALDGIWGSSASDVFVVGNYGTILHYGKNAYITQNLADAGLTPPDPTDAATVMELPAGAYTVHLAPKGNPGNGMMDVYDLETQSTAAVLQGISSRAYVQPGDNILIAGFAIEGTGTKKVAIRGIGQGLRTQGVATDLDAVIEVYDATRRMIASNDDWDSHVLAPPLSEADLTPPDPTDAALVLELPAGEYTVQLRSKTVPGIGLVDVYNLDPQGSTTMLRGIGSRAYVQANDDILISGFIIRGTGTKKVAIRGIGQGLLSQDVPTDLDAAIRVLDATPQVIESNDDWQYSSLD